MRNTFTRVYLLSAFLLAGPSPSAASNTLLITNARLIDGSGAAPLTGVSILVEDKVIKQVASGPVKGGDYQVINADGLTVMPGLVDMHTHPTFEIRSRHPKLPFPEPESLNSSDDMMRDFIDTCLPRRLLRFLQGGITTVISAGGYWPYDLEIRQRIAAGELPGPRLLAASPLFTAPGGHPASGICNGEPWCVSKLSYEAADPASARAGVRRFAAGGVKAIKLVYDSFDKSFLGGPDLRFPRLDETVMAAIIDEAHQAGLPVIAHTKTVDETVVVVRAGVDALVHTALMENQAFTASSGEHLPTLVRDAGLTMTTTVRAFHERLLRAPEAKRAQAQRNFDLVGPTLRAHADAGTLLMFGTDFDGAGMDPDPADAVRSEARALVAAGFSELEVIRMATANAAEHPMVADNLGSIAAGKIADILLLAEDPLEDITAITRPIVVISEGEIVVDRR